MKSVTLILLVLIGSTVHGQIVNRYNLDFEQFDSKEGMSEGWFKWSDYEVFTDTVSHSGRFAGKIISDNKGVEGRLVYVIPGNYIGKTIQLEGYMKIKNVEGGFAGLLMRIDVEKFGLHGMNGGFENMQYQNIKGTKDWKKYTITLPYPEGAEQIYVGGILSGQGEAWFDDFSLKMDGQNMQIMKEKEEMIATGYLDNEFDLGSKVQFPMLNESKLTNLQLLGKIWGFLKYYHPEVGKGNYNWDYELFRVLPEYFEVKTTLERNQLLLKWINNYGEFPQHQDSKRASSNVLQKPDLTWIDSNGLNSELQILLKEIYQNRFQGEHFYVGTFPRIGNPEFKNEKPYYEMPYPDEGFRLLTLFKYWNIVNYFSPNKHLTDKNWDEVLTEYIPKFIDSKNELEYELTTLKLIGEISDSHARIGLGGQKINDLRGNYYPPFEVRFIQGKLVVTNYHNPELIKESGLEIGDVITHIQERAVESVIDSLKPYYPASNDAARMRDISLDILRSREKNLSIGYISEDKKIQEVIKLFPKDSLDIVRWDVSDGKPSHKFIDDNIGYITLRSLEKKDIENIKTKFRNTKGIIIDIRNYPNTFVPYSLGPYFVSSTRPFVKLTAANIDNPGEICFVKELEVPKSNDAYSGKLIVLVNEYSQSQSEFTCMALRVGDNTTIVGSTTAGADGNVSSISLPGGISTRISGMGIYYPDGTETQRVGIEPDVESKPTIQGIKNGRDEVLEKAIELINE
ncbi:S41 family peptidase [Maribacter sp. HTCC2170]|uniref:S41 family peptidase n=1 Tax=Maribacter sp. (strain HTCC2170 / KCCM 42371) TaxID=313603 RepID=UPI00006BD3A7|nr:S41 family peptidase [Maribacter sp. HTCC2170]EAR02335.1 hypothetical protein FB2170_03590 [Maribacter sp. HTCC2170]